MCDALIDSASDTEHRLVFDQSQSMLIFQCAFHLETIQARLPPAQHVSHTTMASKYVPTLFRSSTRAVRSGIREQRRTFQVSSIAKSASLNVVCFHSLTNSTLATV